MHLSEPQHKKVGKYNMFVPVSLSNYEVLIHACQNCSNRLTLIYILDDSWSCISIYFFIFPLWSFLFYLTVERIFLGPISSEKKTWRQNIAIGILWIVQAWHKILQRRSKIVKLLFLLRKMLIMYHFFFALLGMHILSHNKIRIMITNIIQPNDLSFSHKLFS